MLFFFFLLFVAFWLITLPIRILFRLMFGLGGGLLRLLLVPVIVLVFGVVAFALMLAAVVALLAPLVPVALVALAAWAIYRMTTRRSVPAI